MDIVIIADYLGPLDGTYNSRFLYLGDILAKNHNVEIVTSNFNHGEKCFFSNNNIEKHDFKITMINESGYKTREDITENHEVNVLEYKRHDQEID